MPKQERNKQFVEIEKKISTYLLVQGLSAEKAQIHFEEFSEIKNIIEQEADRLEMSSAEFIRWLYLRYLSIKNKIPIEIEKRKELYLTAADLEMTEEQCNIQMRKIEFYKKRHDNIFQT
ncbi:MAG: hypothetical protein ABR936_11885 [Bacteroidota bacterium]|jgi:hypothetical protein